MRLDLGAQPHFPLRLAIAAAARPLPNRTYTRWLVTRLFDNVTI